jgi:hypothetical protein
MTDTQDIPITHLQRRKIEARALVPFIEALREKYGEDAMRGVLDATIRKMETAPNGRTPTAAISPD